jgi:AraC family transcriptional regulator of adaptative response/methylated-DNA-[protein]-cysteine methyltransferase
MERSDYERIEEAILFIERNANSRPSLDEVAAHAGLSPYHFQRLFRRWAGVTPKQFLGFVTLEGAKELLRASAPLLDASLELGLSGPSRLHDLFVSIDAVTPGEFRKRGRGIEIRYGFHETPFGRCLLGITPRGICRLEFCPEGGEAGLVRGLRDDWAEARLIEDPGGGAGVLAAIFPGLPPAGDAAGRPTGPEAGCVETTGGQSGSVRVLLRGTNFQVKVWQALLGIPRGRLVSYGRLAEMADSPGAVRAVGSALGENRLAVIIPCHRVIRASGEIGGYRWGTARKRALIAWEASRPAS